ncbi:hypothetical protein F5X68DRAFT_227892 [Plectosphaerella plurivora]|uniref:DUF7702 domain-containing protein n=1 Tax=Plectosphaerella plurivora TaxID=936078 RepID=A0A9P8VIT3_9PEZI|nr:hypothetical protein F5X68DRAFT_227892 [Plectosphaerella plurivora]
MLNAHVSLGIVEIVVYTPMLPVSIYVLCKNWKSPPRMAWYPIVTFCMLRIAGGIMTIVRGDNTQNINLIIASIVVLGLGTIPLTVALIGLVRIIFILCLEGSSRLNHIIRLIHVIFLATVALFIAGGVLNSDATASSSASGPSRAAYILLAVLLAIAYIYFSLLASPLIAIRIAYGILGSFNDIYSKWDPVFGSALAFGLMALLPEFIAICIFVHLGFYSIKHRGNMPEAPIRDDSEFWGRRRRNGRRGLRGLGGWNDVSEVSQVEGTTPRAKYET